MSRSRDDYGSTDGKSRSSAHNPETEPADPPSPDHEVRRSIPLAPDTVKTERLPNPLIEDGEPVTVGEAGTIYLKTQKSNWDSNRFTSKYEEHRFGTYRRILDADRHFQEKFEDVTTVMLSRRLSPLDDTDCWLTPWECNEMLHGGPIHRSIREALNYHLDAFDFEWVAITAPTRDAGTPHEHIYLWIDDPDNEVTTDHIEPALDKHLKYCENAYDKHHRYQADGSGDTIRVCHSPPLRREVHEKVAQHVASGETAPQSNTAGAQYLASQLVHLHLADYYTVDRPDPPRPLFEGAALAWASPRDWFRHGSGVP